MTAAAVPNVGFFAVMVTVWGAFLGVLLRAPRTLDRAWLGVRAMPAVVAATIWLLTLPWMAALAIWESRWKGPTARLLAVVVLAVACVIATFNMAFVTPN
jgi:hypothetical protein